MRAKKTVIGVALSAVLLAGSPAQADGEASLVRISTGSDGRQGNNPSRYPSVSADGSLVAFSSTASNLVLDDFNNSEDVFLKEVATGRLSLVARGSQPKLSGDGRYVAFLSSARDLVPGDTNNRYDVFVRDRQEGVTTRVSVATDGTQGNSDSWEAAISADGRFVVFSSTATNLVPAATGTNKKVFVHDRETATTTEVSVRPDGSSGTGGDSMLASISGDGRYVAFTSRATDLVANRPRVAYTVVYVRDLISGTTRMVPSGFVKGTVSISADGRYVAFYDSLETLVPGDTNRLVDTYRFDLATDEMIRVNVAPDGTQANGDGGYVPQPVPLSADGRFVFFESAASNLVIGDTNNRRDLFIRDAVAGTTTRVSVDGVDPRATAASYAGAINADGTAAAYYSEIPQEASDTNTFPDVYEWRSN